MRANREHEFGIWEAADECLEHSQTECSVHDAADLDGRATSLPKQLDPCWQSLGECVIGCPLVL